MLAGLFGRLKVNKHPINIFGDMKNPVYFAPKLVGPTTKEFAKVEINRTNAQK